jgi:hypothetical protein
MDLPDGASSGPGTLLPVDAEPASSSIQQPASADDGPTDDVTPENTPTTSDGEVAGFLYPAVLNVGDLAVNSAAASKPSLVECKTTVEQGLEKMEATEALSSSQAFAEKASQTEDDTNKTLVEISHLVERVRAMASLEDSSQQLPLILKSLLFLVEDLAKRYMACFGNPWFKQCSKGA